MVKFTTIYIYPKNNSYAQAMLWCPQTFDHIVNMHYAVLLAFKGLSKCFNTPSTVPPPTVAKPISK